VYGERFSSVARQSNDSIHDTELKWGVKEGKGTRGKSKMAREFGKVTRISVIVTVLVALVMLAAPVLQIGGKSVSPVGDAAAANGSRVFNVGMVDLTGGVSTLSPFMYTMSAEFDLIWPCYSTLLTYDVNAKIVGDLATSWSLAPDGLTWNFKLAQNAYFINRTNPLSTAHPVTATDVMWVFNELNTNPKNHLSSYFLTGTVGLIDSMWTGANQWDFFVKTKTPFAPFLGAMTVIPIVPEYIWGHLKNPDTPTTYKNLDLTGSGAFYYDIVGLPAAGLATLKRNPQWFQEANKGWQLHIDTLNFKNAMDDAGAWTDLTLGLTDVFLNVAPSQYINNVQGGQTPGIIGWAQSTGFVYEYQLNQMTLAQRAAGVGSPGGSNNQLLLDPTVKLAMAMLVDKPQFIQDVVLGLGTVADSLVPDSNPWHYTYPNPVVYDPVAARALLMAAGWAFDSSGAPATSTTLPLCKAGGADPLSFRMLTLTGADWLQGSNLLKEWAGYGGVELTVQVMSTNQANSAWYAGDFDTWLWDWVFTPTSDPSTDCLQVDTSMAIGSWSGSYWANAEFDALYNRSLVTMDPVARRVLTDRMQAMIYEDHNDQLIAYTKYLYAANTANWYGPSFGNWAQHWTLMPDQGYPWLYMQLSPVDNHAPTVAIGSPTFEGFKNEPIPVYGSATDGSPLEYQWYWGDGSKTGWVASASQSHTYATDGIYNAYFAAREQGTADGFISVNQTTITVIDASNRAPTISSITMTPSSGLEEWTIVNFVAAATDLDGDLLSYNWNFNDSYTAVGRNVNHTFATGGSYLVNLKVDDGHPGPGRPAVATKAVSVKINHPPVISIQSSQTVIWKTNAPFTATASDADLDTMRFTWVWDDASKLVTTTPSATHWYTQKGLYNVRVYADDLTGLAGHNVSALCIVKSVALPTPPYGLTLSVNRSAIYTTQSVMFTASARDPGGDGMRFRINCGDGTSIVRDMPGTANDALVTVTAAHTYLTAGAMAARLYVSDGLDNITLATPVTVTVTANDPPSVTPLTNKKVWAGNSTPFSAVAFDPDGDPMRYTWNFGDGTPLQAGASTTHVYAKAGIYTFTVYVNDLKGIAGHNVSSSATAKIAFNIPLAVGWNFVSVPVVGYGYKASNISLTFGDMISSWAPATQKYDKTYIKGISPSGADFVIAPHVGYWIWVGAAKTIHLYGSVPSTPQTYTFTVPVAGGWVALGFESLKTTLKANNLTTMYSGTGAITMVAWFNAATGKYSSWISALPGLNNFALAPGVAYWIWVTAGTGGTLTYIP